MARQKQHSDFYKSATIILLITCIIYVLFCSLKQYMKISCYISLKQLKHDIINLKYEDVDRHYRKYISKIIELLSHRQYNQYLKSMNLQDLYYTYLQHHHHQHNCMYNAIYITKNWQQGYYNWNLQSIYLMLKSYIINNFLPITKIISAQTTLQVLVNDLKTIKQLYLESDNINNKYDNIISIINDKNINKDINLRKLDAQFQYTDLIIYYWQHQQHYLSIEIIEQMLVNYNM